MVSAADAVSQYAEHDVLHVITSASRWRYRMSTGWLMYQQLGEFVYMLTWKADREEVVQYVEMCSNGHFVIMLRIVSGKYKFNGIYFVENNEHLNKINSIHKSPNVVFSKMVGKFFMYDHVEKGFSKIFGVREFRTLTDTVILKSNFRKSAGFVSKGGQKLGGACRKISYIKSNETPQLLERLILC